MSEANPQDGDCTIALAALARGGPETDWAGVERHLGTCASCGAGLDRFTAAVQQQLTAGALLREEEDDPALAAAPAAGVIPFPGAARRPAPRPAFLRRPRRLSALAGLAAAVLVLAVVLVLRTSSGGGSVAADRRPQFVPSLDVIPSRPDHTYYAGEEVQVCLRINQPSRVHLSVLQGHTTFDLYDADSDPGQHCFPERITSGLRSRATLRVEVFYGSERVAREDFPLLPATATPAP